MKHLAFLIGEGEKSSSSFFGLSAGETVKKITLLSQEAFRSGFDQASFLFYGYFGEFPPFSNEIPVYLRVLKDGEIPPSRQTPVVNLGLNFSEKEFLAGILRKHPDFSFSEAEIKNYMQNLGWIEPDLVIITGGIRSIGDSLTWSIAYSELFFSPVCWRDFSLEELDRAFQDFSKRERRFGKINE
ncbi:MAG: undecaprenyl diphosphate synthase family protein [Caldiserica bacterium]|jgi:hypothetical protein|nr:undecaprenyl diphosphate synthase family protein [Caldisericota bacterium]MDH7562884.1 undecaprenyl diphosphate synthase family protein [Caldisericota bacterium]